MKSKVKFKHFDSINDFEYAAWEIVANLSRPQCVKHSLKKHIMGPKCCTGLLLAVLCFYS